MPRGRDALPEEFEENPATLQVRCKTCHIYGESKWMQRSSSKSHLRNARHSHCVDLEQENILQAARRAAHLREEYENANEVPVASHPGPPLERDPQGWGFAEDFDLNGIDVNDYSMDIEGNPIRMSAGEGMNAMEAQDRYMEEMRLWDLEVADDYIAEEPGDTALAQILEELHGAALDEDMDEGDIGAAYLNVASNSDWAPYTSKTMFLMDVLDNLPRLRSSNDQLQMTLFVMREAGAKDVPTLYALRKVQQNLQKWIGGAMTMYRSITGNIFYANDLGDIIAKDYANPLVAPLLHFYPKRTTCGARSEAWEFSRWSELPRDLLTPMVVHGTQHYFVNELAKLRDGRLVIPLMWVYTGETLSGDCYLVELREDGLHVHQTAEITIPVSEFTENYLELLGTPIDLQGFSDDSTTFGPRMPNPLRAQANGLELYTAFIFIWADDVSGNVSKMYNKHYNLYTVHTNIPGRLLQQAYFVRFFSTSPHASSSEQFAAVGLQIRESQKNPIRAFNADTHRECLFRMALTAEPGDNPQQSDNCSHIGHQGNRFCRRCDVGGPAAIVESNEGYHAIFAPGQPRTAPETRAIIEEQLNLAKRGVEQPIKNLETDTGIKDKIGRHFIDVLLSKSRKRLAEGAHLDDIVPELTAWLNQQPGPHYNPLLSIYGTDPHPDTPVEILHTILIGIVKYAWYMLHSSWPKESSKQSELFVARLRSTNTDGLSIPPLQASYIVQYRNNLIGKHFKQLMQTMAFHVHGIAPADLFTLILAVGELGAVLWFIMIDDLDLYLTDLQICIDNVLNAFTAIDPTRILVKIKLHVLTHLPEDIRRFGPAIRFATEVFEAYNSIFRSCSVLSNHQAASRDIGAKFGQMERVKHALSGGYWLQDGVWVQAGKNVRSFLRKRPQLARQLGWASHEPAEAAGTILLPALKKREPVPWTNTQAAGTLESCISSTSPSSEWYPGLHLITQSGDKCSLGSWVVARDIRKQTVFGRISEMLVPCDSSAGLSLVVLEVFVLSDRRHSEFGMPILARPSDRRSLRIIPPHEVEFIMNVQHDCRMASCSVVDGPMERQERQDSGQRIKIVQHIDDNHFIINTHSLHNAHLLRRRLPRALTAPRPLLANPQARHNELAAALRVSQATRRAQTAAKRKATMAAKKQKAGNGLPLHQPDEASDEDQTEPGPTQAGKRKRK